MPGKRHKWPEGWVSKAQWRFAFSKGAPPGLKKVARKIARRAKHKYGKSTDYRRLPRRKGARRRK